MSLRRLMIALGLSAALPLSVAFAQNAPIKLGVMNDVSGVYADFQGAGSAVAARLAVEDFGGQVNGRAIEVILGDHQNKVDIGTNMARQWFDRDGVELILDVPNSAIALSVSNVAREKNKVFIASGGVTSELTGKACSPNTIQWMFDNWSLANGLVQAVIATGGDTWFFLTSDYAFGHDLERSASAAVANYGGKVVGSGGCPGFC
ncbi:ABC transporter substrate-binding protein [Microbacteriaceae bacterium K1510]|nr:ABC transporter substrate-binding protein [Microbacteriaceae bacterium K1510]